MVLEVTAITQQDVSAVLVQPADCAAFPGLEGPACIAVNVGQLCGALLCCSWDTSTVAMPVHVFHQSDLHVLYALIRHGKHAQHRCGTAYLERSSTIVCSDLLSSGSVSPFPACPSVLADPKQKSCSRGWACSASLALCSSTEDLRVSSATSARFELFFSAMLAANSVPLRLTAIRNFSRAAVTSLAKALRGSWLMAA